MASLDKLFHLFDALGDAYRNHRSAPALIPPIVEECYRILKSETGSSHYNDVTRKLKTGNVTKKYFVFKDTASGEISRPYRQKLFIDDYQEWLRRWNAMIASIDQTSKTMNYAETDRVLYSASTAFFAVIDLFMRDARKRNGTFFEWLLGTLLHQVTGYKIGAHIAILATATANGQTSSGNDDGGSVPTDIVLDQGEGRYKLVFPAKISTRERINQIFTHQRILDVEFPGEYRSALLCVSECQLLKKASKVQETCIPKQVTFNEKYVAHVDALYYLDPPFPYVNDAIKVPVRRISDLFASDLKAMATEAEKEAVELCGHVISTVKCNRPKHSNDEHRFNPPRGSPVTSKSLSQKDVGD